jgi:Arc/MetJ-type ribon-helix-helix transcriptional regulator
MNITLNPEVQERIEEKVRNGEFESASAIVEQAVTFFLEHRGSEMDEEELFETRAAIDAARGQADRGESLTVAEFEQKMRAKYDISR